eukprot:TRINITY_DN3042_c0_g1_i3.p1 TRINITY_DN3042_c0_g1~~TRINITY_DN3042_c0_g1_i3.p1  ORF type:complete len:285 (-),score=48.87 TRINITY_DN3042_c0_g1_i3:100-954(-)
MSDKVISKVYYTGGALSLATATAFYISYLYSLDRRDKYRSARDCTNIAEAIKEGEGKYVIVRGTASAAVPLYAKKTKDTNNQPLPVLYSNYLVTKLWKDRKNKNEAWVRHSTVERRDEETASIKLTDSTGSVYPAKVVPSELHSHLSFEEEKQPTFVQVENVLSDNVKVAGFRHQEWVVPEGGIYTCVGTMHKESGDHFFSLTLLFLLLSSSLTPFHLPTTDKKGTGNFQIVEGSKPYFLTTNTPLEIDRKLDSETSFRLFCSLTATFLGLGLVGAGVVNQIRN